MQIRVDVNGHPYWRTQNYESGRAHKEITTYAKESKILVRMAVNAYSYRRKEKLQEWVYIWRKMHTYMQTFPKCKEWWPLTATLMKEKKL